MPLLRLTGACDLAGRAGGWNSEALLRLAQENPRLHAALLKTHAAADHMSTQNVATQSFASAPLSPARVGGTSPARATRLVARPAAPAVQSASGPSPRVSSCSQTELITALRPAPQPARHESASQTQPRLDPAGGSCSPELFRQPGNDESFGVECSSGSPVVRFSLRVSQDAAPGSPSCQSATMQVLLAARHPQLGRHTESHFPFISNI